MLIFSYVFLYVELESGQHVDTLPMFSIALDPRVVNMWDWNEYVVFFGIREWSTCSINLIDHFGLENGHRCEIRPMCSIALDLSVASMLIFYEHVLVFWI